ncbi:MAG: metallophosphoesterase [Lachnospiraceae bacterium]|nr:metallophosphoesterase [Lachnospiraceae bacterium]
MKYLVISDSHGYNENIRKVIEIERPVEAVFHCGDLECHVADIERITGCSVIAISGNNDFYFHELQPQRMITRQGHRILMVHGHRQGVNFTTSRLLYLAMENQADIVMFGHTHIPCHEEEGGITLLNPGSISIPRQSNKKPTYAIMEISEDGLCHFTMKELS